MKLLRKIQYNSPVILTFALVSLGVLLLGAWTGGASTALCFSVYRAPLNDPFTYLRFFGPVLGHADYNHYIGNMTLLLVIGPPLEERYGSKNLLEIIAATALISGLVQFICFPGTALLGASGIVFMLIILSAFTNMKKGEIPLTLILVTLIYLGQEVYDGLFTNDNISHFGHIEGGVAGLGFGIWYHKKVFDMK